jgi:hypothetical protein
VKACFGPFGHSVNLNARYVYGLRQMCHGHGNLLRHTYWYSKVMCVKWRVILVYLETVLIKAQDRCTVCAKCTMGMENFSGTPNGTSR